MKAFVVYESMFGNTHEIAAAIAAGLGSVGEVELGSVGQIAPESVSGGDLIVVGGPTHMHGMSRSASRDAAAEAAEQNEDLDLEQDATGPGAREWLGSLPKPTSGGVSAAFDTRIEKPALLTGSAAKGIAKQLRRRGYEQVDDPESFFVAESNGPLKDGEIERARNWGRRLAERCREGAAGP